MAPLTPPSGLASGTPWNTYVYEKKLNKKVIINGDILIYILGTDYKMFILSIRQRYGSCTTRGFMAKEEDG